MSSALDFEVNTDVSDDSFDEDIAEKEDSLESAAAKQSVKAGLLLLRSP